MSGLYFFIFILGLALFKIEANVGRIEDYLLIGDFSAAAREAACFEKEKEVSTGDISVILRAYALAGHEEEWFALFDKISSGSNDDLPFFRTCLEDFCWGILRRGFSDSSNTVRTISVLASGMAGDVRAGRFLKQMLEDDSDLVRYLSVNTVAHYPNTDLKRKLLQVIRSDPASFVRIGAYAVTAQLNLSEAVPDLIRVLNDKTVIENEKRAALKALAVLEGDLGLTSVHHLLSLRDSGLLSCGIINLKRPDDSEDRLLNLLACETEDVKIEVLRTAMLMGKTFLLNSPKLLEEVRKIAVGSHCPRSIISSAALLTLADDREGYALLEKYLVSDNPIHSGMAAGFIPCLGKKGLGLASLHLSRIKDLRTKVDLALSLLLFRTEVESAGNVIKEFLSLHKHNLRTFGSENIFFPDDEGMSRPGDYNNFLGFKFINLLMVCRYSNTHEVFAEFLSVRNPGGFGLFSRIFWEDEESLDFKDFLEKICDHPSYAVRLEGVLSSLSLKDNEAVFKKSIELYRKGGWQEKIAVLEALAVYGGKRSVPFLLSCCKESMPSVKTAAAGALFMVLKK